MIPLALVEFKTEGPVFFDLNSKSHQLLGLNKYSIVTVQKGENRLEVEDFGSDRVEFLKTMRKSFE